MMTDLAPDGRKARQGWLCCIIPTVLVLVLASSLLVLTTERLYSTSTHSGTSTTAEQVRIPSVRRTTPVTVNAVNKANATKKAASDDKCAHMHEIRFQQNIPFHLYRGLPLNDPLVSVPLFYRVFEEYAEMHRRHFQQSDFNFTQDLLAPSSTSKTKYIYLNLDVSGLGNRLNTVISAFLFAILTKRVLLVSSVDFDMNALLCQPFRGSNWIWPSQLNFDDVVETARVGSDQMKYLDFPGTESCHLEAHLANNKVLKAGDRRNHEDFHILYFANGEMYFLPILYLNPQYRVLINRWFPERNPGTYLTRYLLHPRDDVWRAIVDTYTTLRTYSGEPTTDGEDRDTRWVVPENAKPLPTAEAATIRSPQNVPVVVGLQLRNTQYEITWNCLYSDEHNHAFRQFHNPAQRYHIFMSSMFPVDPGNLRLMAEKFPINLVPSNWKFFQHFKDVDETLPIIQVKHALHDIWILSMVDEAVLTPRSTFGYMSMLLRGQAALYPFAASAPYCPSSVDTRMVPVSAIGNSANAKVKGIPTCYRAKSTEGCFHRSICGDYNATDFLTRCEDICDKNGETMRENGWKVLTFY